MRFRRTLLTLSGVAALSTFTHAQTNRFAPDEHFPARALVHVSIENIDSLMRNLSRTLPGRIVTHPGWKQTFRPLLDELARKIDETWQPAARITGKSLTEILNLFRGQVALIFAGIADNGLPEVALAVEVADGAGELPEVLQRIRSTVEEAVGQPLPVRREGDVDVRVWPTPQGPVFHMELGDHIVFVTSDRLLREILDAYSIGSDSRPYASGPARSALAKHLVVDERQLLGEVDVAGLLHLVEKHNPAGQWRGIRNVLGAGHLTAFGYALGFRDGGMQGTVHLGTRPSGDSVFGVLGAALAPLQDVDGALARVPANFRELNACGFSLTKALRRLEGLVRAQLPDFAGSIDEVYARIERSSGISKDEINALPDLSVYMVSLSPPAGGLFPDGILLVKTDQLAGYWTALKKVAAALGGGSRARTVSGVEVEIMSLFPSAGSSTSLAELFEHGWQATPGQLGQLLSLGLGSVVRSDLQGGWTVISTLPQSVVRYVKYYAEMPMVSADEDLTTAVRKQLAGVSAGGFSRGGVAFLSAYNTVLGLASVFSAPLAGLGVELAHAPPAEVFLEYVKNGTIQLAVSPDGLTLRGHRWVTSSMTGSLAVVGGAAVVAGLVVPVLLSSRKEAYKIQCANNLKSLYEIALQEENKSGRLPHSADGSLVSVQLFADSPLVGPEFFICPAHARQEALKPDPDAKLTEASCSYKIVPWKPSVTDTPSLYIYDKAPQHDGVRMVVFTNGAVLEFTEDEFQEQYEKERKKHER